MNKSSGTINKFCFFSMLGIFRYYCTVCGKGQPGPKKFVQHMFKQHNVENPQIPKPYEDLAPDSLIQQHKAVVQAENDARLAKAASNMKKEKEKVSNLNVSLSKYLIVFCRFS